MPFRSRSGSIGSFVVVFAVGAVVGLLARSADPAAGDSEPTDGAERRASGIDVRAVTGVAAERETRGDDSPADGDPPRTDTLPAELPSSRADRAMRSTVSVRSGAAYGAGVLVTRDGLVLTASHVVVEEPVRVRLLDGAWQRATVVARDAGSDLCLLRMDADGRKPPRVASVLGVRSGDRVLSVGSPRQLRFSVSRGIVSFVGRRMRGLRYLQTDLLVHPGSSGGPVLDEQGRVVGIMSFALRGSERIGFALPLDYAFERFGEHLDAERLGDDRAAFQRWVREL